MTTTPPPMPEIDGVLKLPNEIDGNLEYHNVFTEAKVLDRDAQWMERITSLEADRKMLREALTQTTRLLGELVAKDAQTYAPYMRVIDAARTALENTK